MSSQISKVINLYRVYRAPGWIATEDSLQTRLKAPRLPETRND